MTPAPRIRIGISACLLGEQVRFDGGHKRDAFLTDVLGPHVEWVPVCPEVEVGMGTPREPVRLVSSGRTVRMLGVTSLIDHTDGMREWSAKRLDALAREDLCGYMLKANSPSCGLDARVFGDGGAAVRTDRGLFARALLERFPSLPVAEEGHLSDPVLRGHFIGRVFASRRLKDLFGAKWTTDAVVRFHTAHEMQLLAHSARGYRELGRLVAHVCGMPRDEFREVYERRFMSALSRAATPVRHGKVLMHMAAHLDGSIDSGSKAELLQAIDRYRRGLVPIVVPMTLIRDHARAHDVGYLRVQSYLEPDPRELMVRSRV